ncbi:uncharacterized protein AKAME5_001414600 [Lates japonicus]|uniref:Uncharacterized protein n=1 Tax=Lates japonicus TaxID=270547 RepID=A0AAD3MZN8_LATJO|nr:uncharacterized protein AKAME5_001414600 [Lates japonicus]
MDPSWSAGHPGAAIRIFGTEENNLTSTETGNNSFLSFRRPQALQPLALQIGHTGTANQIAMGRDCRDGDVHQFSTTGQTGHSGTSRMIQGGFLEAQTALTQQAHRHRRAHLRQAREQRRHKVVYTVNVGGPNTEGVQRLKLVRRPTERDIFWDESTGERLDPSCLLEPESQPLLHQPDKQLMWKAADAIQNDQAQVVSPRPALNGWREAERNWIPTKHLRPRWLTKAQRSGTAC